MSKDNSILPILAGITKSIIYGFSFFFIAEALIELAPMHLLGYRFAFAALTLTILHLIGLIKIDLRKKKLGSLIILAIFQPVVYFTFETVGVKMTSGSEAGMLIATIPVVVTFLSVVFLNERPTIMQIISILVSVSGVFFIILMTGVSGTGNILGTFALFGAVFSAGIYNILSRKLSVVFKPVEITFVMVWIGAITFNGVAVVQHIMKGEIGQYLQPLTNKNILVALLYLGILSSICAFFLVNFMLSQLEASRSAVFSNLTTIIAILAGVIFRNESFYWFHVIGGLLILLGVYGTNYFGSRRKFEIRKCEDQKG